MRVISGLLQTEVHSKESLPDYLSHDLNEIRVVWSDYEIIWYICFPSLS